MRSRLPRQLASVFGKSIYLFLIFLGSVPSHTFTEKGLQEEVTTDCHRQVAPMLQPAAITALLSQLIDDNTGDAASIRPHTALLTLVESSELYAVATKLVDSPPSRGAVASILASTAAATGTAPPPSSYIGNGRPAPLTLDERAACLSAIAVTCWRQATEGPKSGSNDEKRECGHAGATVSVAKHAVTGMTSTSGKRLLARRWSRCCWRAISAGYWSCPSSLQRQRSVLQGGNSRRWTTRTMTHPALGIIRGRSCCSRSTRLRTAHRRTTQKLHRHPLPARATTTLSVQPSPRPPQHCPQTTPRAHDSAREATHLPLPARTHLRARRFLTLSCLSLNRRFTASSSRS